MRIRREVRWLLWGLWSVCLAIAIWIVVTVIAVAYVLITHGEPFGCWTDGCAPSGR
ncbi:hypothetical protein [Streptomyces sp. CoH27]|uniref:hypothetical protein n=1 Tax=Streptomyces sp. CoH27 TaxID=2875763 RepID=UPI001CD36F01|nr:hypothetical protein [Streptomyces sp. CoH27]